MLGSLMCTLPLAKEGLHLSTGAIVELAEFGASTEGLSAFGKP